MIEIRDKALCCGCGACAAACMPRCIKMSIDEEGFSYPIVAEALCSGCGACEKVCPFLNPFRSVNTKGVYLLRNRDISVRQRSSSGGAFALLAELFCQQDGLVFGAALNQDIVCVHSCADNLDGCREFMGSKYVQSDLGNSYMKAGEALKAGRQVFFSGTPCQVAGLKHYLGREYDNLFCADFICHGVPSPGVFALYVDGLRNKYPNLKTLLFRHKQKGWQSVTDMSLVMEDGYIELKKNDKFLAGFLLNLYLRPSCHACMANSLRSGSDITLADYWGAETKFPAYDDGQGLSLLIVKNDRGIKAVDGIRDRATLLETTLDHGALFNKTLYSPSAVNGRRKAFFEEYKLGLHSFEELSRKHLKARYILKTWLAVQVKKIFGYRFYNRLWCFVYGRKEA